MLTINNLSVDEINAALIAIQNKMENKGTVLQQVSQQAQGSTQSVDYGQEIKSLKNAVASNTYVNERQSNQISDIFNLITQLNMQVQQNSQGQEQIQEGIEQTSPLEDVYFDGATRTLTILTTSGETYTCVIPEGTVINENYVYDPTDNLHRLKLDINGLTAQKGTVVDGVTYWEDLGTVGVDMFGNIILNNSGEKEDVGFQVEGSIYHFDDYEHLDYDESGANTKNITVTGQRKATGETNPILYPSNSPFCVEGTVEVPVTTTMQLAFFSKSDSFIIDNYMLQSDGTLEKLNYDPYLTGYNEAMEETSEIDPTMTVGEYLGLNAAQIQAGIFK